MTGSKEQYIAQIGFVPCSGTCTRNRATNAINSLTAADQHWTWTKYEFYKQSTGPKKIVLNQKRMKQVSQAAIIGDADLKTIQHGTSKI